MQLVDYKFMQQLNILKINLLKKSLKKCKNLKIICTITKIEPQFQILIMFKDEIIKNIKKCLASSGFYEYKMIKLK